MRFPEPVLVPGPAGRELEGPEPCLPKLFREGPIAHLIE